VCGRAVTPGAGARRRLRPRLRCARRAVAGCLLRVPHRHGGRGRQTADADSLLCARRADARRWCALPCGRWSRSDTLVCAACHAVRGRSLGSLRPSRHARCWCFSEVAGVRCSMRLSGPQHAPPPGRRRVPASKLARASGPPLLVTPPAGVSAGQPSRQPVAGCHAACGGLTAPPYRSLRSLGGAVRPGSGRCAPCAARCGPCRHSPAPHLPPCEHRRPHRGFPPSQAVRRANGRPAGRCARPSSRRTAWGLPWVGCRPR